MKNTNTRPTLTADFIKIRLARRQKDLFSHASAKNIIEEGLLSKKCFKICLLHFPICKCIEMLKILYKKIMKVLRIRKKFSP